MTRPKETHKTIFLLYIVYSLTLSCILISGCGFQNATQESSRDTSQDSSLDSSLDSSPDSSQEFPQSPSLNFGDDSSLIPSPESSQDASSSQNNKPSSSQNNKPSSSRDNEPSSVEQKDYRQQISCVLPNDYSTLCVPTYFTKVDNTYFIVDCYHDQIIYSDSLSELSEWHKLPGELNQPHTISSDGTVYLVDDTENNRVVVYEKIKGFFTITQTFELIGIRPHYIQYNEADSTFYVWSSMTGEMYLFQRNTAASDSFHQVELKEVRKIDKLDGVYVRSFTIDDDMIYFVSGNKSIIRANLSDFSILEEYAVPDELAGMIQLSIIDSQFYITVSTDASGNQDYATFIRTKDLHSLAKQEYEDIYSFFIGGGTPYYISQVDGFYYLTEHRLLGHSLWRF